MPRAQRAVDARVSNAERQRLSANGVKLCRKVDRRRGIPIAWFCWREGLLSLSLSQVRQISADVAQRQQPPLDVVAAAPVEGGTSFAEVILTVRGCRSEPCVVVIAVSRNGSEADLRRSVDTRLRQRITDEH